MKPEIVRWFSTVIATTVLAAGVGIAADSAVVLELPRCACPLDCAAADLAVRETKAALAKASGRDVVVRGGILAVIAAAKVPDLAAVEVMPDWDGRGVDGQFDPQALAAQIKCPVMVEGLEVGDDARAASPSALFYAALKCPKRIRWARGFDDVSFDDGWMKAMIDHAVRMGARRVDLPGGRTYVSTADKSYFSLVGVNDLVVDFHGADLIGRQTTRFVDIVDSTNVTLRGVSLDYEHLPFTQALIEKVDADGNWDVRIIDGYPCPTEEKVGDYEAWPIQVYGRADGELVNPMRYQDDVAIVRTGAGTFRISGGKNRAGSVGDYAVWSLRSVCGQKMAINVSGSANCRFEDISVYSTPMGCGYCEVDSASNAYVRCRLVRRPPKDDFATRAHPRLRSGNHDALNARRDYVGPALDGCDFEYQCDDGVNISGFYAVVSKVEGRKIRILPYCGKLVIAAGDPCQVLTADGNVVETTALAIEADGDVDEAERGKIVEWNFTHGIGKSLKRAWKVTLDRDAAFAPGSCIISARRRGDGFSIVRSHFGSNRSRGLLIKASNGTIANNVIERVKSSGIAVYPEFSWLEGGCSQNLEIRGNLLRHGATIVVGGRSPNGSPLPPEAHANCRLADNVIETTETNTGDNK